MLQSNKLEIYIENCQNVLKSAAWKIQLARHIQENIENMGALSDDMLRVIALRDVNGAAADPVRIDGSTDAVYRKLGEAETNARKNSYTYGSLVADRLNDLRARMEHREMREEEYIYLRDTPMESLVDELIEEFSQKYPQEQRKVS